MDRTPLLVLALGALLGACHVDDGGGNGGNPGPAAAGPDPRAGDWRADV